MIRRVLAGIGGAFYLFHDTLACVGFARTQSIPLGFDDQSAGCPMYTIHYRMALCH